MERIPAIISVLLLSLATVGDGCKASLGGRRLTQCEKTQTSLTSLRPAPVGGGVDDWDVIQTGSAQASALQVLTRIKNPGDALLFGFGNRIFESESKEGGITRLVLNSEEEMEIQAIASKLLRPGILHHFQIVSHTENLLISSGQSISIEGSQFYILVTGYQGAQIEVGWLGNIDPSFWKAGTEEVFSGIFAEWVDRFKGAFKGGDCVAFGPKSVVRDLTGVCNNIDETYGAVNTALSRVTGIEFGDGLSSFGGSDISPRWISNIVAREDSEFDDGTNRLGVTDMFVFFGQFVDHDIGISPIGEFTERRQPLFSTGFDAFVSSVPIDVPEDDPDFVDKSELDFDRAVFLRRGNQEVLPRQIVNQITSFLDLSQVYASGPSRTNILRAKEGGRLRTSDDDFLPFNSPAGDVQIALENAPDATAKFHIAGDIRSNENIPLLAVHTIWLREHNKVADELKEAFGDEFNDEELFQFARAICIAEYQSILYTEWLPLLIGYDSPSPDDFLYNPYIDASADAFFTTVSFRFGHSMVNRKLWNVKAGSQTPFRTLDLRDVFFRPEGLKPSNFDAWIRGMAWHEAREPDELVIDDLRSFLLTDDGAPSSDLVAINLQRARDMGVPTYNTARAAFGLPVASSFWDISNNEKTVENLSEAYEGNIDIVDSFLAGLAESKPEGRMFGDLFHASFKDQFERLRDGDRYFYKGLDFDENLLNRYPRLNDILEDRVKFIDIIARTSGVTKDQISGRPSPFQL